MRPAADVPAEHLLELVGVADSFGGGVCQRLLHHGLGGVEGVGVVNEAADEEVGRVREQAGVGVHDQRRSRRPARPGYGDP